MKVKRILLVCVFALILMLSLAACDDSTADDNTPPEHEHTIVIDDAVPTTCKNSGLTSGAHCSECGEILVEQEKIDKLEHTVVVDEAVDSTCDKAGLTSGAHCSECGEILVAQSEISPKPHTYNNKYDAFCNVCGYERDAECEHLEREPIVGKPASCEADGLTDGEKCAKCGEIIVGQEIIPPSGHNFENLICTNCGAKYYSTGLACRVQSDGTCTITGIGSCADTEVYIPEYIKGYRVTGIGNSAFYGCGSLTSIEIPDSVTSIGNWAFNGCSSLTNIVIPDSVTSIGDRAFSECSSLTSVTIGNSVTSIGYEAFWGCDSLTSIVIPDSVTSIGNNAFSSCVWLTYNEYDNAYYLGNDSNPYLILIAVKDTYISSCTINSNTRFIHSDAFAVCYSLTSVVIPDSVTSIGDSAFRDCSSLASIVIPDSVTSIGDGAFFECLSLTSIVIPDSVTSIGNGVFAGCYNLESITVEEGNDVYHSSGNCLIETASKTLIAGCKNSVIPADGSVTIIGDSAFDCCFNLMNIVIPDSVTSIGDWAFYGCSSLTSIVIPDSVTSIGYHAFSDCSSLTSIVIPDSVTSIGYGAFMWCYNLESITVEEGNDVYHSSGNCLIETASKTLIAGCNNSVIPTDGSVTSIGYNAFYGCYRLTSIVIPDSVTSIGYNAFYGCYRLTSIVIPDSVTSIGDWAFYGCSSLTSIVIPASVTSIGDGVFAWCYNLESITVEEGNDVYHSSGNCLIETASKTLIAGCNNSVIPTDGSVTSIGDGAFEGCDSLTSIVIPDSVTSIGYEAFWGCSSLTNITFEGTIAQWNDIYKDFYWNDGAYVTEVVCSDGIVTLN